MTIRDTVENSFDRSCPSCTSYYSPYSIRLSGLVDVTLEGYAFTWSHPSGSKMSKLDRFLISDGIFPQFPSITAICLDRHLSDHRPILLREMRLDFGPIPFKFYHSWFDLVGFDDLVKQSWLSFSHSDANGMIRFKKKLQDLKGEIDKVIDRGENDDSTVLRRLELKNNLIKAMRWNPKDRDANSAFVALIHEGLIYASLVNDFRPISLIGCIYKVVTKILANRLVSVISDLVSETQSAFVAGRQILDGPFILDEVLHWCKRKKNQAMFFKVDFAKAYDSVRWDYLLDVLEAFGFGHNWCKWIKGTLYSARASVLINGSPSKEFSCHRGLKQGDPLAPYLFILIMESLHISFSKAVDVGLFKGKDFYLPGLSPVFSLFFNADYAMFLANVPEVDQEASSIGCSVMHNQFRYLGVMVGQCPSRLNAWDDIIFKLRARLSKWKVKTLSIGGRLTLLKSILGSSPIYNLSIFKVPRGILKNMESIRCRFFNGTDQGEKKITWVAWDKALASKLHGESCGSQVILLLNRDAPLHSIFPRLFALELDKNITVAAKLNSEVDSSFRRSARGGIETYQLQGLISLLGSVSLSNSCDRWFCDLSGDGVFRVKEVRKFIDDLFLPSISVPTRWSSFIPIKVNVFVWRSRLDCLPTRVNLVRRGVHVESSICPICFSCDEDVHHTLFCCDLARPILRRICR
ncbi:RNA-directed DNA polymerase, eukaryota [Tanacetum coccineum]